MRFSINVLQPMPPIDIDPDQIHAVLEKLLDNAVTYTPEGGKVTITTKRAGRLVRVEVKDTGIGIPPENLTKIFDPFFTTKDVGHGTGLGLAVCYGILSEHGGRLDVRSSRGTGTTFTIALPISEDSE